MNYTENLAKAFFELCHENELDERIKSELAEIVRALDTDADATRLLDCPGIPLAERQAIVCDALEGAHEYTKNLVLMLTEERSSEELRKVAEIFNTLYDDAHKIERVVAVSAIAMTDEQLRRLRENLEKKRGSRIVVENRIDPSLLGGVLLEFSDTQTDATVSSSLDRLHRELLEN